MLQIIDSNNEQSPLIANNVAVTDSLSDFPTLSFDFLETDENKIAAEMMLPRTKIVEPITNQIYRILTSNPVPLGKVRQNSVSAIHISHDLHDKYCFSTLKGSQSLEACMKFLTSGTKFKYEISGTFKNYSFSDEFGKGYADDLFKTNLAGDFGFEFYFDNYTIHIQKKIGIDNSFVFVDGINASKISVISDYSEIATHIKGEGKHNDKDKPIVTAEYTSPLAKNANWGSIDAELYENDTITNEDTLLKKLKENLKDYPDVQYSMEFSNFSKNVEGFDINKIKVGNSGWLRDRFGIDINTRIFSLTYYPQDSSLQGQITFGNKKFDPIKWQSDLKKAHADNQKIGKELTKKVANASQAASDADSKATQAYSARISGTSTASSGNKLVELNSPEGNLEMGLNAGEKFYPITNIGGVVDLDLATETTDGLLSSVDKLKIDNLEQPIISKKWLDQVTGKLVQVTVENNQFVFSEVSNETNNT